MGVVFVTDNRKIIKNILTNTVAFLMIITAISGVYFLVFREVYVIWWLLAIPFFLMQFLRAKITDVYIFILMHLVVCAYIFFTFHILLLVDYSSTNWFILAFMIISIVYSFIIRIVGERSLDYYTGIWAMALYVLFFIIVGVATQTPDVFRQQLVGSSIITLGFVIIHIHMDNIDSQLNIVNYIDNRTHRADKVIAINNKLIVMYAAIVAITGILIVIFPLWRAIFNIFRAIARALPGNAHAGRETEGMIPSVTPLPLTGEEIFVLFEPDEYIAQPPSDEVEFETTIQVFYIGISILFAIGVVFAFYLFLKYFYRRRMKKDEKDKDGDENIALTRNIMEDLKDLLPKFGRYSKNAIRRAYAKKVNSHIRRGVSVTRSDTTDIIADKIRIRENIDELTTQYEKVRYFND